MSSLRKKKEKLMNKASKLRLLNYGLKASTFSRLYLLNGIENGVHRCKLFLSRKAWRKETTLESQAMKRCSGSMWLRLWTCGGLFKPDMDLLVSRKAREFLEQLNDCQLRRRTPCS